MNMPEEGQAEREDDDLQADDDDAEDDIHGDILDYESSIYTNQHQHSMALSMHHSIP